MKYENAKVGGLLGPLIDGTRMRIVGRAIARGGSVLEIGCGNCQLVRHLPAGVRYFGIDIDPGIIAWARQTYPQHRFKVVRAGVDPLPEGAFDVVVMAGFIEHIEFREHLPLLKSVRRVIAADGVLVLTTPTVIGGHVHRWMAACGLASKEAAAEHKGFLSGRELCALLCDAGFSPRGRGHYLFGMAHIVTASVAA